MAGKPEPFADLLRTQIARQQPLDQAPDSRRNAQATRPCPHPGTAASVGSRRFVPIRLSIAPQLTADRARAAIQAPGNLPDRLAKQPSKVNLISFDMGEMSVGHLGNFDCGG
jgi:hypothetical protein